MTTFTRKLDDGQFGSAVTTLTSASWTPTSTDGRRVLVACTCRGSNAADPTLTGNGITWTLKQAIRHEGSNGRLLCLYEGTTTGSSAGGLTITRSGAGTFNSVLFLVDEGSDNFTIGNVATNDTNTVAALSINITVGGSNGAYMCASSFGASPTCTEGTGYTSLGLENGGGDSSAFSEYRTTTDTNADCTWSAANNNGGIALEVIPGGGGFTPVSGNTTRFLMLMDIGN